MLSPFQGVARGEWGEVCECVSVGREDGVVSEWMEWVGEW